MKTLEVCAGAGGMALGLEAAGWKHSTLLDNDEWACATLRHNRPEWNVIQADIATLDGRAFDGIDLFAGGLPCPPFSQAGKQLGPEDERDLFPEGLRLISECRPKAVMIENVYGFMFKKFDSHREAFIDDLESLGYLAFERILTATDYGVPQKRRRYILVALRPQYAEGFAWPEKQARPPSVGEAVKDIIASGGWEGAEAWAAKAKRFAPTILGGSKNSKSPALGPTSTRREWERLGFNSKSIANMPPGANFPLDGAPRVTLKVLARLQGFPDHWTFLGNRNAKWQQIGNALPAPLAEAVGRSILAAL